jgi:hypothetical protein
MKNEALSEDGLFWTETCWSRKVLRYFKYSEISVLAFYVISAPVGTVYTVYLIKCADVIQLTQRG